MHQSPRYTVVDRSDDALYEYIATPVKGTEEFYDLTNDPKQTHDLVESAARVLVGHLRDKLREYLAEGG